MKPLRNTEFFYSASFTSNQLASAIQDAKAKRDDFVNRNIDDIDEIVDERIDFANISIPHSAEYLYAVITLSYYTKK